MLGLLDEWERLVKMQKIPLVYRWIGLYLSLVVCSFALGQVSTLSTPRVTVWEKIKDDDGIIIYEGDIKSDGAVPLKGHVVINHPMEKVVAVMADTEGKKDWLPAAQKIKILEQQNPYIKTEYYLVEMPFVVSDRTATLRSEAYVSDDLTEIIVNVKSSQLYPEENSNYIRAQMDYGQVRLRSIEEGKKTIVSGIFYTNPKGYLPNWIVKRFTRNFVYQSLQMLRNKVGRNLYDEKTINKYVKLIKNYNSSRAIASSAEENQKGNKKMEK